MKRSERGRTRANEGCSNEFNSITVGIVLSRGEEGEQVNRGQMTPISGLDAGERAERFVACSSPEQRLDEREGETRIGIREERQ